MKSSACILSAAATVTVALLTITTADEPPQQPSPTAEVSSAGPTLHEAARRHAALARTGDSRFDWNWLAERFDRNQDGTVTKAEFPHSARHFDRLDCTWNGVLSADDFDWSGGNALCRQKETAFALFKSVDTDSDGRLSAEEWQVLFSGAAREKGYLHEENLQRLMYLPGVLKVRGEQANFDHIDTLLAHNTASFAARLPEVGEPAPDFELQTSGGQSTVRLSSYRTKKPVVLIFGCFTCGNYRIYPETLEEVYERWKDQVEFVRVYVREAHPSDNKLTSTNARAGIVIPQATSLEERCTAAGQCAAELKIDGPLVVDTIDNRIGKAYGGWPDRLYIIDREGKVAYRGDPGPFGFNPRELEQGLMLMLMAEQHGTDAK